MNGIRTALHIRTILAAMLLCLPVVAALGAASKGTSKSVESLPAEFWAELGGVYMRWQVYDKADEAFDKAIELASEPAAKARIYQQLAQAQIQAGDGPKALAALDAAIELASDDAAAREYRNQRAEVYLAMGDVGKAIDEYEAVLALGGTPSEQAVARQMLLDLHKQAGTLDKVVADATARLDADPNDADALEMLRLTYAVVQPDNGKLAGVLERIVAADPDDTGTKRQLVDVYRELGQHDKAAALLEAMVKAVPKAARASYYSLIAEEYAAMGETDTAAAWIDTLRQAGGGSAMVRLQVAKLYGRIGKTDEALAEFALAVETAPTTSEKQYVQLELARFYFHHGMRRKAQALLETLVDQAEDATLRKQAQAELAAVGKSIPREEREKPDDPNFIWPD